MKHHSHCHLDEQVKKFRAGKLGLLGGILIIGHLFFHVAECLIIPAIIVALNRHDAEAIDELSRADLQKTTFITNLDESDAFAQANFLDTLEYARPLRR